VLSCAQLISGIHQSRGDERSTQENTVKSGLWWCVPTSYVSA
jgi:hypothetical protein